MIQQSFKDLIDSIAARNATPGGGATAALSACMGVALLLMVVRFSRGKKRNREREPELEHAESFLQGHLERFLPLAERDCASFDLVSQAYGLAKDTDEQKLVRNKAIEEAVVGAMVIPEETLCLVRDVFVAVDGIVDCVGKNIVSDLGSASEMLRAAAEAAFLNVRINGAYLQDKSRAQVTVDRVRAVRDEILRHHDSIRSATEAML